MTGRPRRASTSSVETVDENTIQWRQETSVLKSVPKDSDSNNWPVFELRDAVVLSKDGKTPENALDVSRRGPFIIRGTLIIDEPDQRQHLIMKVRYSIPLEVRQSTRYSIGEAQDGHPVVWVSGKGGWYEINPSSTYLPWYNKMCEAATLYYRIMDIYRTKKPQKAKKSKAAQDDELSALFLKYATMIGDGSTIEEVRARCAEHSLFLISQSAQEDTDLIDWKLTLFNKWLTAEFGDRPKKAEERSRNTLRPSPTPSTGTRSPSVTELPSRTRTRSSLPITEHLEASTIDKNDFAPSLRSSRSRSSIHHTPQPGLTPQPQPKLQPDVRSSMTPQLIASSPTARLVDQPLSQPGEDDYGDGTTPFESVLNALEDAYEQLKDTKHGVTITGTLNKIYFANKFPTYRDGTPGSHRLPVEEVLHYNALDLLQRIDKAKYEKHEFYSWLQELATKPLVPVAIKPTDFPFRILPRGSRPKPSKARDDSLGTPQTVVRGGSPSLNGNPLALPGTSRAGKAIKRPGRQSGKKSSLRLATSGTKRPHSEVEGDSDSEESTAKKSHYFSEVDDTQEDASSEDEAEEGTEPIKIVIHADRLPSTVPRGPDEAWTCDQEGCDYVVRGGDAEKCQQRIRAHFEEHEEQVDRVNLALTEGTRGHMPINHLLDKIKKMGEKAQQEQQISVDGVVAPQPIKRKLIV